MKSKRYGLKLFAHDKSYAATGKVIEEEFLCKEDRERYVRRMRRMRPNMFSFLYIDPEREEGE